MTEQPLTYRGAPVAPPDAWLPLQCIWTDKDSPTDEDRKLREEGIRVCIEKAYQRRIRQRSYAKKHGKPVPALNDELVPAFVDYIDWPRLSNQVKPGRLFPHVRDIWTPERAKELEEIRARREALNEEYLAKKEAMQRLYAERRKAREKGLPVPPTPAELKAAEDGNRYPPQWYYRPRSLL